MAHTDPIPTTAPVAGIAEPHQSTVAAILRAAEMGVFTSAQAELLIDRVRALLTAPPIEFPPSAGTVSPPWLADALDRPNRTVS
jgi:hypothetical protein